MLHYASQGIGGWLAVHKDFVSLPFNKKKDFAKLRTYTWESPTASHTKRKSMFDD